MRTAPRILICDDDQDDRVLLYEAFGVAGVDARLGSVKDGLELVKYLESSDGKRKPRPDIILLDVNIPKMDGWQALEWIKSNPKYRAIPVVMLTTSSEPAEVDRCYRAGADSFITKGSTFERLVDQVKTLSKYWTGTVELP